MNLFTHCRKLCNYLRQSLIPELPPAQTQAESPAQFDPQELANNPTIETANRYADALRLERDRYESWARSQVCFNCKAPFGSKPFFSETNCLECLENGFRGGKRRADMLAETGNRLI